MHHQLVFLRRWSKKIAYSFHFGKMMSTGAPMSMSIVRTLGALSSVDALMSVGELVSISVPECAT